MNDVAGIVERETSHFDDSCDAFFRRVHFDASHLALVFDEVQPVKVTIEQMPELRVGAVRHMGSYMDINRAFAKLGEIVARAGIQKRPEMVMLAIYYDDPQTTPAAKLRSDAALSLPRNAKLPTDLVEHTLPGGRYARVTHVGPYQTLGDAWGRLIGKWLPASGERMGASPSYEIYRNSPETTQPQDLRTDLYIPLEAG